MFPDGSFFPIEIKTFILRKFVWRGKELSYAVQLDAQNYFFSLHQNFTCIAN